MLREFGRKLMCAKHDIWIVLGDLPRRRDRDGLMPKSLKNCNTTRNELALGHKRLKRERVKKSYFHGFASQARNSGASGGERSVAESRTFAASVTSAAGLICS